MNANNMKPTEKTKGGGWKSRSNGKVVLFSKNGNTAITCWDGGVAKFHDEDDAEYRVLSSSLSAKAKNLVGYEW